MNKIKLAGFCSDLRFSHEIFSEKMYEFFIHFERWSGTEDVLPCIVSETLVNEIRENEKITVFGEIRTKNKDGRLLVYVFVNSVSEYTGFVNEVSINGFVCREPHYHETPLGRVITDLMIASNRGGIRKSDYIPCIAWGRNAVRAEMFAVGTELNIAGRLQSRLYLKKFEDGTSEMRRTYELSISHLAVVEKEESEEQL